MVAGRSSKEFWYFAGHLHITISTAIYDKMLIILMGISLFTLKKIIAKFMVFTYAIPVFPAGDLVSCLTRK